MALITFSRILIVCVVAVALQQIFSSSSSNPIYLENLPSSSLSPAPSNGKLQNVIKLGEGFLQRPEDVAVDENGVLYTVTRDGSGQKMHRNGTWEKWWQIESSKLIGITVTAAGDLIVCACDEGLLKVNEEGVKVLTSYVDGSRMRYRCLKYWVEGEKKGKTEIFVDKLPGRPDNINLAPDGSFWIALLEIKPMWPRFVYSLPGLKYLAEAFPEMFSKWVANTVVKAMVVNVGNDGKIIRGFDDPTGKVMKVVTSAVEFEGHLYLGSLYNDFVGKLLLAD